MNDVQPFYYRLPSDLDGDIEAYAGEVQRFLAKQLPPAVFKAKRVPRGIYEQRRDGTYMLRVRVAGGALSAAQTQALAEISRDFSNGSLHVTTRQDVQFHDVAIADTPQIMRRLKDVGLTSKGGGGNTVRNVAACPYAGICPAEAFDVTPFAHAVTEHLIALAGSYNLPRKYKIAFSGCAGDCALARVADLGFIAAVKDGQPGFTLYAGGGMGTHSRLADRMEEWMPGSDAVIAAEAGRRLFDRLGDRADRRHARLRFVLEKIGADAFRAELRKQIVATRQDGVPLCDVPAPAWCAPDNAPSPPPLQAADNLRFIRQKQAGFVAVPLHLPLGFLPWRDFGAIGELAGQYSSQQEVRTTRSQNLLLRFVRPERLPELAKALRRLETDVVSPSPLECFVACAGASTCRLGLCLARGAARAGAEALGRTSGLNGVLAEFDIHISGCPNACGHHPMAGIGFFGVAQRHHERLAPSYRVVMGARDDAHAVRLAEEVGTVPARALPGFLVDLARDFKENRTAREPFIQYFERQGLNHFQDLTRRHAQAPEYAADPLFYRDWGQEQDFSLAGRGAGECGAGVFEVIRGDIAAAKKALDRADKTGEQDPLFDALLATVRALLITRGVDTQAPDAVIRSFETHFVETGLVSAGYRGLLARARGSIEGWHAALEGRAPEIKALLERIETLFDSLDGALVFHPPETDPAAAAQSPNDPPPAAAGAVRLDLSGVACPMNFVKAKLKLETMTAGEVLRVVLDDGEPVRNVPASFKNEGQAVLATERLADGHWQVDIRKNR
ncbi:MAG: sulfurtransferase TusA family protein [Kiritimatiellia bacterium]|jgi:sulfite reductase (ferredoxin)